jgi:hypothetical protein
MRFDVAERIADAVLYERDVFYPPRSSPTGNRIRWQNGVIAPKSPDDSKGEPWFTETACLVEPCGSPRLSVRFRCLQVQARRIEALAGEPGSGQSAQPAGGHIDRGAWDEAVPLAIDVEDVALAPASEISREVPLAIVGGRDVEAANDAEGHRRANFVRERRTIAARLLIEAQPRDGFITLRLRVENREPWRAAFDSDRSALLRYSLMSPHLVLAVEGGRFVSLLEPPASAAGAVATCRNQHTWPVLVGDPHRRDVMLSSPILMYDYPVAPDIEPDEIRD